MVKSKTLLMRVPKSINEYALYLKETIEKNFGLKISKVQALKILNWKAKKYNIHLTEKDLIRILSGY